MRRLFLLAIALSLLTISISSPADEAIEKYWERACSVTSASDDIRSLGVWADGGIFATVNRQSGECAIQLYNTNSGLMEEITEALDMTGIPSGVYSVCSGDFSEDGAFFACSLSYTTGVDLEVYYWATIDSAPVNILDQAFTNRLGDALDVTGQVSDNSVTILISGNNAASQPVRITYNGSSWTATTLGNAVRAQDIDQVAGGAFYATYAGGDIVRYNSDGSVDATVVSGAGDQTSIAVDETRGLIYSMGYAAGSVSSNHLKVYEISTGNLLADLASDPLDVNGFASDPANGSSAVEIVENAGGTYIYALSENNGCARYSYSTVLTVGPTGDFATVQGAISSYCITGGTQTGAVKPLVLSIDPAGGPYDEAVTLLASATGYGDIAGDLVLKSSSSAKAVLHLQEGNIAADDGLSIHQDVASVIFKNLILCPSQTNPFGDDMLVMLELNDNSVENWVEFYDCIITAINADGDPMITSNSQALAEPGTYDSSTADGDTLFRFGMSADTSYSRSLFMDQSVIYGSQHLNYIYLGGTTGSQARLNNTIISQCRAAGIFACSFDGPHQIIITGDDQTQGILTGDTINCSAIYEFNRRLFYDYAAGIHTRNSENKIILVVKNSIIFSTQDHSQTRGISSYATNDAPATPRGVNTDLYKLHDVIIDVPSFAIVDDVSNDTATPMDIRRVTISAPATGIVFTDDCSEAANITDSIFADCSIAAVQKFLEPSVNVNLINCGLPMVGDHAIAAATEYWVNATITDPVETDPLFLSTVPTNTRYYDVRSNAYKSAASDGGDLVGGANYAGGTQTAIDYRVWNSYR